MEVDIDGILHIFYPKMVFLKTDAFNISYEWDPENSRINVRAGNGPQVLDPDLLYGVWNAADMLTRWCHRDTLLIDLRAAWRERNRLTMEACLTVGSFLLSPGEISFYSRIANEWIS